MRAFAACVPAATSQLYWTAPRRPGRPHRHGASGSFASRLLSLKDLSAAGPTGPAHTRCRPRHRDAESTLCRREKLREDDIYPWQGPAARQSLGSAFALLERALGHPMKIRPGRGGANASVRRKEEGTVASRAIAFLTTAGLVAAMIAPAFGQSSGASTGTGSAPATGSGSSMPSSKPAPSATQPGSTTPAPGAGSTGKAKPGASTGQSGASAPSTGGSMPSASGSTSGASKSGMSMDGAGSEQVKSVQKALQDKGMDPGPIDGMMGPKTMAALKAFQKDQKLTETGRLDDQTREKLGVTR
jgi:hypothetical protein